jgi:hypothetical protein
MQWTKVQEEKFDWLILTGKDEGQEEMLLWLVPAPLAGRLKSPCGQITCVTNGVYPPRRKAEELNKCSRSYEELRARCLEGKLA